MANVSKAGDLVETPVGKTAKSSLPKAHVIELPPSLVVRQLADLLRVNAVDVIKQLMRAGLMVNINQAIDYEVAATVAKTLGYETRMKARPLRKTTRVIDEIKKRQQLETEVGILQPRPPVVTVMGHVDHGKTRLLDAIRQTNVMDTEAGAITQHIGAYQVTVDGQKITFLDTPGHEAFTAMRAHGAQVTDIIVLVVAADDGVMPQTLEAINHARAAKVPIVVAINKIDKPEANPERVKQQLADVGLIVEEWGGDTVCLPVSAKEKIGISVLLENLLVVAEMEELKADPNRPATGTVVEAKLDKTRGPLATVLVQNGTLKLGDTVAVGTTWGRVKAMFNDMGKRVKKAESSTPVEILGLSTVAEVGDVLTAVESDREAEALLEKHQRDMERESARAAKTISLSNLFDQISAGKVKELNISIKTDVQGSIEPIRSSLEHLETETVQLRIIHSGTGGITESDVMLAIASKGLILGFSVTAEVGAQRLASTKGVDIRHYDVIYTLIDDVAKALKGMLEPTYAEVVEGRAEVRAIFPAGKGKKAAGGYVSEGKVSRNDLVRVLRSGKVVVTGSTVSGLRRFKEDVKDVAAGYECGVSIQDFHDFQVGDVLEFYTSKKTS